MEKRSKACLKMLLKEHRILQMNSIQITLTFVPRSLRENTTQGFYFKVNVKLFMFPLKLISHVLQKEINLSYIVQCVPYDFAPKYLKPNVPIKLQNSHGEQWEVFCLSHDARSSTMQITSTSTESEVKMTF